LSKEEYDKKKFIDKLKEKQTIWQKELRNYVRIVPEFKAVFKEIMNSIDEK